MATILVVNNSGNVGKTTLSEHLLVPRIKNADILHVESINNTGDSKGEKLTAKEYSEIFDRIFTNEGNLVVDVGSSNIEEFSRILGTEFEGSVVFFDYIVIPVVPDEKQQLDSITTALQFSLMGVPDEKIKFIFNKVDAEKNIESQFNTFLSQNKTKVSKIGIVRHVKLFESLEKKGYKYSDVANDLRDHMALIKSCKDIKERAILSEALLFKQGFNSYHKMLDEAFKTLNLK